MQVPTFRRLQVFVTVAESGSFAAAARHLGIAQPSVSAHIQSLEAEWGALLFERRSGRQPQLSDKGRSLLAHARALLANASRLEAELAPRRRNDPATLTIVCQRSLANAVLRKALVDFAQANRDIRTSVRVAFQEEVLAGVRGGAADVGLLLGNEFMPGVTTRLIGRQAFVVYAAPDHPLARRRGVRPSELAGADFVGPPAHTMFGRTIARLLDSIGIAPIRITAEITEFSMSRDFAAGGLGLGCSLEGAVQADIDAGRVVRIDLDAPPLFVDILQLLNPKRPESDALRRFSDFLAQSATRG